MIDVRLLRHLWAFLAVAEERHFGRAAERLGISQPPLSQQIQTLERSLGVRLFERSRHGATLTQEGLAILPSVRRFTDQMGRLEAAVRAAKQGHSDLVTIGAITSTFYEVLPSLLEDVRTSMPNITTSFVEIHTFEAPNLLQNGVIDLAFARMVRDVETVKVIPISTDVLTVALSSKDELAARDVVDIRELADRNWIQVRRHLNPPAFDRVIAACSNAGFSPRLLHEVGSEASQVAFVSCGLGVALLPSYLARGNIAPNVVFRPLVQPIEIVTISLAWDEHRISKTARSIIEQFLAKRSV
jgi:DNA-binding transcriptional LysR family regulator